MYHFWETDTTGVSLPADYSWAGAATFPPSWGQTTQGLTLETFVLRAGDKRESAQRGRVHLEEINGNIKRDNHRSGNNFF